MTSTPACAPRRYRNYRSYLRAEARSKTREIQSALLAWAPKKSWPIAEYYFANTDILAPRKKEFSFPSKQTARLAFGYPSTAQFKSALWALKEAWKGVVTINTRQDSEYKINFCIIAYPHLPT